MEVVGELHVAQGKMGNILVITTTPLPPLKPKTVILELKHPITDVKIVHGAVVIK